MKKIDLIFQVRLPLDDGSFLFLKRKEGTDDTFTSNQGIDYHESQVAEILRPTFEKDGKVTVRSETWYGDERDESFDTFDPGLLRVKDPAERTRLVQEARLAARSEWQRKRDEELAEIERRKEADRKKRSDAAKKGRRTMYERLRKEFEQDVKN